MNKPVYCYEKLRYGFFVHYVADLTHCVGYMDGRKPQSYDEVADGFDVPGFAEALAQMQVEYLIFTSWHFRMIPLYPSEVTAKWRPDCCIRRDLLGEIIDAVRAKGIRKCQEVKMRYSTCICANASAKPGTSKPSATSS